MQLLPMLKKLSFCSLSKPQTGIEYTNQVSNSSLTAQQHKKCKIKWEKEKDGKSPLWWGILLENTEERINLPSCVLVWGFVVQGFL